MPLVSVLLAVHDGERFLREAAESVLHQTLDDLELIVIDDGSNDRTPEVLDALSDDRVVVLRNENQAGLAASLNRGLDRASGQYVARIDADDVADPARLQDQIAWMKANPGLAVLGTAVWDLDATGRMRSVHTLPAGATAVRWHALFSSPFFHPTVLVDREILDAHSLRYDPVYLESEDYDLWTRLFAFADGDNLSRPLVYKRVHAGQASLRRRELQESFQRRIARREMARVAPGLDEESADLAWDLGRGQAVPPHAMARAGEALQELLVAFERLHGVDGPVREAAGRSLGRAGLVKQMLKLTPFAPVRVAVERVRRPLDEHRLRKRIVRITSSTRVVVVSPEPTPYRSPLFDRLAEHPELDLTVVYAARTVAHRPWSVVPRHRSVFLRGLFVPGARRLLRHDYPVTPGIARVLHSVQPDVVVVSGWSTFAAQAAIAWCRGRQVPYLLLIESHDLDPRSSWRQAVKGMVVPRVIRGAAGVLAVGTAAKESAIARGAQPDRVQIFANTIDVARWIERADQLPRERSDEDIVVLAVARLVHEKGLDLLVRSVAEVGDERLRLVLAGEGPERKSLGTLAARLGVRLDIHGDLGEDALAQLYVDADVFALLSRHEPWGVVVNEAAASGLPLVLSDRVGAARDLLHDGENGHLVPAGDVQAAAAAFLKLADDADLRARMGARSRELVRNWGYEPSADSFIAAVREATSR